MRRPSITLQQAINRLEDGIVTLSGPALAVSGIIAGVDLLTGGHVLQQTSWLALGWAICLLLTLDFQVLALGARSHRVYLSDKPTRRKMAEIALAFVIAAGVSFVSIQMQSIVARVNTISNLSIDQAASQLGINTLWLTWERSTLVLVLIFMSGWFRQERSEPRSDPTAVNPNGEANSGVITGTDEAIKELAEQVSLLALSVTEITTTVTEVKTTVIAISQGDQTAPPREVEEDGPQPTVIEASALVPISPGDQGASIEERVREALAGHPELTDRELAARVGCSSSTANKWRKRIEPAA